MRSSLPLLLAVTGCATVAPDPAFDAAQDPEPARLPRACDVRVPADEPTVQAGIDAAPDGATICIAPGTYQENLAFDDRELHLVGAGPSRTILDGGGVGSVIDSDLSTFDVKGLTIRGGEAEIGGGMSLSGCYVTLTDVTLTANHATITGGAFYDSQGDVTLDHTRIVRNASDGSGGGLSFGEIRLNGADVVISGNTAAAGGGGIVGGRAAMWLERASIVGNHAGQQGGGLSIDNVSGGLVASVIAGNTAGTYGGGADLGGYGSNDFDNIAIVGNRAPEAAGAYVSTNGYQADFDNAIIAGNRADGGNTGGVWVGEYSYATFAYTDFWHNASDVGGIPSPVGADGNLAVDPMFVAYGPRIRTRAWDFHLAAGSPLIDAGDPAVLDADGSASDIGAYGGPYAE
jgi:hypothetical protein